jgi:hypothetical protein
MNCPHTRHQGICESSCTYPVLNFRITQSWMAICRLPLHCTMEKRPIGPQNRYWCFGKGRDPIFLAGCRTQIPRMSTSEPSPYSNYDIPVPISCNVDLNIIPLFLLKMQKFISKEYGNSLEIPQNVCSNTCIIHCAISKAMGTSLSKDEFHNLKNIHVRALMNNSVDNTNKSTSLNVV